jgi:putative ABC transport system substrate-binding protein
MKRRAILAAVGAWLAAAAAPSFPQSPVKLRRVAFLHPGTQRANQSTFEAFRTSMKGLGYAEGREISLETRWAEGRIDRLPSLAAELAALDPAVIVTGTSAAVAACKRATSTIPIVFTTASSPVEQGFVSSLSRPGGNITGVLLHTGDLTSKNAEFAREALPRAQRLAILVHDADPAHMLVLANFLPSAQRFKFEPVVLRVANTEELDRAFRELADRKADALYLPELNFMITNRDQLIARSMKARLPLLSNNDDITTAGGLMSYGTAREENYRRAAALVDKILRGAKPGDLPVEQPERFQLVVNRKTAKAIGVTLSPVTMLRADRIID